MLMSELPAVPRSDSRVLTDRLMSWLPALPSSVCESETERVMSLLPEVPNSPSRVAVETLMSWLPAVPRSDSRSLTETVMSWLPELPSTDSRSLRTVASEIDGGVMVSLPIPRSLMKLCREMVSLGDAEVNGVRGIAEVADDCVDGDRWDADTAAVAEGVAEDLVEVTGT